MSAKYVYTLAISGLVTLVCIGWMIAKPGWDAAVALLISLSPSAWVLVRKKRDGKGGHAIVVGEGSDISIENMGVISAGKGGGGGDGGHAIHTEPGIKMTIINNGTISGGDAGK